MINDAVVEHADSARRRRRRRFADVGLLDGEGLQALVTRAADLAHSDADAARRLTDLVEHAVPLARSPQVAPAADHLKARLLVQAGEPESALRYIERARDGYLRIGSHLAALRTDLGRMHVLDDLGRHVEATAVGRTCSRRSATWSRLRTSPA